jgi:hypothetical protein
MKPLVILLLALSLIGCDRDPTESSKGTWKQMTLAPMRYTESECVQNQPSSDCIMRHLDAVHVKNRIQAFLSDYPEQETKVLCKGKEKKPPKQDHWFILNQFPERKGVCTLVVTGRRKADQANQETFRKVEVTYEENNTWKMDISAFTPSDTWMD